MSDVGASGAVCRICHTPLARPGAPCPRCQERALPPSLPPAVLFAVAFLGMALLFAAAAALTGIYRAERTARRSLHIQTAREAVANGRYEEAISQFRDALEYDREDFTARLGLAQALVSLGRLSEARNYLSDLHTEAPTHAVVSRLLGDIAALEGEPNEAASHYRAAIYGRWPQDPTENRLQTRLRLIELLSAHGDPLQEVSELVDLMSELPEDRPTRKRIGRLLLDAGAPEWAARVLEDVVEEAPDDAEAWASLGRAEFGRGHYLSARTAFTRSRVLDGHPDYVPRLLDLSNQIVDLDPTYRRAGTRERLRRSLELLQRTLAEAARCVEASASELKERAFEQARLEGLVVEAEALRDRDVPASRSEEFVAENMAMTEALWQARLDACPGLEPADEPLRHILEKLGQ